MGEAYLLTARAAKTVKAFVSADYRNGWYHVLAGFGVCRRDREDHSVRAWTPLRVRGPPQPVLVGEVHVG